MNLKKVLKRPVCREGHGQIERVLVHEKSRSYPLFYII